MQYIFAFLRSDVFLRSGVVTAPLSKSKSHRTDLVTLEIPVPISKQQDV